MKKDKLPTANATRDAIRDVSLEPALCQILRRKTEIRVQKQVDLIGKLKVAMIGKIL